MPRVKSEAKVAAEQAVTAFANEVVEAYAEAKDAEVPVTPVLVVAPVVRPCALDDAPLGSKVVISRSQEGEKLANLTTPDEVIALPKTDLSYTLPVGAKVRRKMPSVFEGVLLNPSEQIAPLIAGSGREAIEQFRDHFNQKD